MRRILNLVITLILIISLAHLTTADENSIHFTESCYDYGEDYDDDELFNALHFGFDVYLEKEEWHYIGAVLGVEENDSFEIITFSSLEFYVEYPDTYTIELEFEGADIFEAGMSSEYQVEVWISNEEDYAERVYYTSHYNYTDFNAPVIPPIFTGNATDYGNDTDSNGLYNYLTVEIELNVTDSGYYELYGSLYLGEYYMFVEAFEYAYLENGTELVTIDFDGERIYLSEASGEFWVELWVDDSVFYLSTDYYEYTEFERPVIPATFTGNVNDFAVDENDNGLYDYLAVEVEIRVNESGEYEFYGYLCIDSEEEWGIPAYSAVYLEQGIHAVSLNFEGVAIYAREMNGPYDVEINMYSTFGEWMDEVFYYYPDSITHITDQYDYRDFEHSYGEEQLVAEMGDDYIKPETDVISTQISKSIPDVIFYYTKDNGASAKFRVKYNRLIGYDDLNNNGLFDEGEEVYEADLTRSDWMLSGIRYYEGEGRYIEFEMNSNIDMTEIRGDKEFAYTIRNWANLTFNFVITTTTINFTDGYQYSIKGGVELKINIKIEILKPLNITGIALEHKLLDETYTHNFQTLEADGVHIYQGISPISTFKSTEHEQQFIEFINSTGVRHGYYSWRSEVEITYTNGTEGRERVSASYRIENSIMTLYLCYALKDIKTMHHDPAVGVFKENEPKTPVGSIQDRIREVLFNPWVYSMAVISAVAVILVIRRLQKE